MLSKFRMPRVLVLTALMLGGLVVFAVADAEFSVGAIVKKFELPQRDDDGKLTLTIFGREATVISANRIKVDGLRIDIFSGDQVETVITAASSDYWRKEERLTTESGVEVQHPNFKLTAEEMNWELESSRGDFKDNVQLKIKRAPQEDPS